MVLHVLHRKVQQQLIPGFKREVHDGLSGLFRSPEEIVHTDLNISLTRVIYIITMLELSCIQNHLCWKLTNALETQSSPSVAYYFLVHLQTSHTRDATAAL